MALAEVEQKTNKQTNKKKKQTKTNQPTICSAQIILAAEL